MKKTILKLLISIGLLTLVFTVGVYTGAIRETERFFRMEDENDT